MENIHTVSPSLLLGRVNGDDVDLLTVSGDQIRIRSAKRIYALDSLKIILFDHPSYQFHEISVENAVLTSCENKEFAFHYAIDCSNSTYWSGCMEISRDYLLGKIHVLKNADLYFQVYRGAVSKEFHNDFLSQKAEWLGQSDITGLQDWLAKQSDSNKKIDFCFSLNRISTLR